MMKINLDYIESQLRSLFEEALIWVLPGEQAHVNLIDELLNIIDQNLNETPEGSLIAPDKFTIAVRPEEISNWQTHQELLDDIAAEMKRLSEANAFHFISPPSITVASLPVDVEDEIDISGTFSEVEPTLPDTAAMEQHQDDLSPSVIPRNAFLVVGGKTNFPLITAVINIGRHSDNDLVLADDYVSRHHAQIRAINSRYVVFDVGSTGGIFINGKQITQATLHPGDVLRMGTINLIYIQDTTSENPTSVVNIEHDNPPFGDPH